MQQGQENENLTKDEKYTYKLLLKQQVIFTFLMVSLGVLFTILIVKK